MSELVKKVKKIKTESEIVKLNITEPLPSNYTKFKKETFKYSLNVFDFEVFGDSDPNMADWGVVISNPFEGIRTIIVNDVSALKNYYIKHARQIWAGYNNSRYDNPMLIGILQGINPGKINNGFIKEGLTPYQLGINMSQYPLYGYDCMFSQDLGSLKLLEAYGGLNIEETSVPFDIKRRLTREEWDKTIFYCKHDVDSTVMVLENSLDEYVAKVFLCEHFEIPFDKIGKTKASLSATILEAVPPAEPRTDEWDLQILPQLQLKKFKWIQDWYMDPKHHNPFAYLHNVDVYGTKAKLGWGGIHSALLKYNCDDGIFYHIDVTSYYPSMMIKHHLLSRNCKDPSKFENIFNERVKAKRDGFNIN